MILETSGKPNVEELREGMRRMSAGSGSRKFTVEEKAKILEVLRVLVS